MADDATWSKGCTPGVWCAVNVVALPIGRTDVEVAQAGSDLQVSLWLGAISVQSTGTAVQPSKTKAARALQALLRAEAQGAEAVMQVDIQPSSLHSFRSLTVGMLKSCGIL